MSAIGVAFPILIVFPTNDSYAGEDQTNEPFLLLYSLFTIYILLLIFCLGVKALFTAAFGIEDVSMLCSFL